MTTLTINRKIKEIVLSNDETIVKFSDELDTISEPESDSLFSESDTSPLIKTLDDLRNKLTEPLPLNSSLADKIQFIATVDSLINTINQLRTDKIAELGYIGFAIPYNSAQNPERR